MNIQFKTQNEKGSGNPSGIELKVESKSEARLNEIKTLISKGKVNSVRELSEKVGLSYCYTSILVNYLREHGEDVSRVYRGNGVKGNREARDSMIKAKIFSFAYVGRVCGGASREAIRQYAFNNFGITGERKRRKKS